MKHNEVLRCDLSAQRTMECVRDAWQSTPTAHLHSHA